MGWLPFVEDQLFWAWVELLKLGWLLLVDDQLLGVWVELLKFVGSVIEMVRQGFFKKGVG